jgi:hypothetical protein
MTLYLPDGPTGPAQVIVSVTLANNVLPNGTCKALLCGTSGTLNGIDAAGNVFTGLPLQQGYNPISIQQASTGGTATNIWALY